VTVYSDTNFVKQNGIATSNIRESPHVEINREGGEIAWQPSSVDLHLDDEFLIPQDQEEVVYVDKNETYPTYNHQTFDDNNYFKIEPYEFVLGQTQEDVHLDESVVGFLWGRSSVGRMGEFVHNAGLIDAGWDGDLVLEFFNASPNTIALKKDMRIVQMTVHDLKDDSAEGYDQQIGSKYNGQSGVTPSRLSQDFNNE